MQKYGERMFQQREQQALSPEMEGWVPDLFEESAEARVAETG